jgi:protein-disulfide isomerase
MATPLRLMTLASGISARDHILGPASAPVTLVEYGDYECPDCGRAHLVIRELRRLAGDVFRFVFRHFPLMHKHQHAERAAEAAEAAGVQGQFWEMHDTLFENQEALGDAHLVVYAAALRLDIPRYRDELAAHAYAGRVGQDIGSGAGSGVVGTPTFFIDDIRYTGRPDLESMLAAIREGAAA